MGADHNVDVLTDRPIGVALWWKGGNHMMQYSLLKVSKGMVGSWQSMVWVVNQKYHIACDIGENIKQNLFGSLLNV